MKNALSLFLVLTLMIFGGQSIAQTDPFAGEPLFAESNEDEFLPVDEAYQLNIEVADGKVSAIWQVAEAYYLYRHAFKFTAQANGQALPIEANIAKGKAKFDEYFGDVEVYYHQAVATIDLPQQTPFELTVRSQGCADAGLCYPPQKRTFVIDPGNNTATFIGNNPSISISDSGGNSGVSADNNGSGTTADTTTNTTSATLDVAAAPEDIGLLTSILWAMLGGLILNLMPCVFPVLTLKVLSFAGKDPASSHFKMHGIVYTVGVVVSFVAVAAIMLALRASGEAIGWGFQLQSPWVIGALTYLFFAMALSLGGMVEFGSGLMGVGQNLASKDGYSGSFFTGVLAVVVASPCTAPFMGSALGYAITQPPAIALSIFAALGFGMALPFLAISLVPALAKFMPSPGPWMDRFKRVLAFPLLATCVWLVWVAGNQTSANGMALILLGCLSIAFGLWVMAEPATKPQWQWTKRISAIASVVAALYVLQTPYLQPTAKVATAQSEWQPYSAATLQQAREQGQAVFINITADWCITCLANERVTLSQDSVKDTFKDHNVLYLKGDWTNYDAKITALLGEYQRSGIPLYLYYPADKSQPAVVLPQVLTPELVINTISSDTSNIQNAVSMHLQTN